VQAQHEGATTAEERAREPSDLGERVALRVSRSAIERRGPVELFFGVGHRDEDGRRTFGQVARSM